MILAGAYAKTRQKRIAKPAGTASLRQTLRLGMRRRCTVMPQLYPLPLTPVHVRRTPGAAQFNKRHLKLRQEYFPALQCLPGVGSCEASISSSSGVSWRIEMNLPVSALILTFSTPETPGLWMLKL